MELGYILQHSMQERNVGIISLTSLVYETVLGCQKKGINTHLKSKIKVFEIIICDMEERQIYQTAAWHFVQLKITITPMHSEAREEIN